MTPKFWPALAWALLLLLPFLDCAGSPLGARLAGAVGGWLRRKT